MPEIDFNKRAPITRAPSAFESSKWGQFLSELQTLNDKMLALDLSAECLVIRAQFAAAQGVSLPLGNVAPLEQRYLALKQKVRELNDAADGVKRYELGAVWRDHDFDIIDPGQSMGAIFIPVVIGALIIAGCFAYLYEAGKANDSIYIEYKKLNQAAENVLCKDPNSDLCKKWNVVKAEQKIVEKESFGDTIKKGLSKGLSIGIALVIGLIAFSFWRKS